MQPRDGGNDGGWSSQPREGGNEGGDSGGSGGGCGSSGSTSPSGTATAAARASSAPSASRSSMSSMGPNPGTVNIIVNNSSKSSVTGKVSEPCAQVSGKPVSTGPRTITQPGVEFGILSHQTHSFMSEGVSNSDSTAASAWTQFSHSAPAARQQQAPAGLNALSEKVAIVPGKKTPARFVPVSGPAIVDVSDSIGNRPVVHGPRESSGSGDAPTNRLESLNTHSKPTYTTPVVDADGFPSVSTPPGVAESALPSCTRCSHVPQFSSPCSRNPSCPSHPSEPRQDRWKHWTKNYSKMLKSTSSTACWRRWKLTFQMKRGKC